VLILFDFIKIFNYYQIKKGENLWQKKEKQLQIEILF
jgi:hypothetical protein